MTTLLTWEPRRFRVLVAKTLAAAIGVFAMILVLDLLFTGLMALVAATRGSTVGTDTSLVRSLVGLDVRVATLAAFGAILGLSLAMVTRNTGATLGIAFVYLVIVEGTLPPVPPRVACVAPRRQQHDLPARPDRCGDRTIHVERRARRSGVVRRVAVRRDGHVPRARRRLMPVVDRYLEARG